MEYLQALLVYFTVMTSPPPDYMHFREPDGRYVESWAWYENPIASAGVTPEFTAMLTQALGKPLVLPALDGGKLMPKRTGWLLKSKTTVDGIFLEIRGKEIAGMWWRMKVVPYEKGHENDSGIEALLRSLLR